MVNEDDLLKYYERISIPRITEEAISKFLFYAKQKKLILGDFFVENKNLLVKVNMKKDEVLIINLTISFLDIIYAGDRDDKKIDFFILEDKKALSEKIDKTMRLRVALIELSKIQVSGDIKRTKELAQFISEHFETKIRLTRFNKPNLEKSDKYSMPKELKEDNIECYFNCGKEILGTDKLQF